MIVNINPGSICITCQFINGATELGCLINLLQNDIVRFEKRFLRSPITSSTSSGCVNVIGLYDLYVYDIESDNSSDLVIAYKRQNILILEPSSTQVITSTTSVILLSTSTVDGKIDICIVL